MKVSVIKPNQLKPKITVGMLVEHKGRVALVYYKSDDFNALIYLDATGGALGGVPDNDLTPLPSGSVVTLTQD